MAENRATRRSCTGFCCYKALSLIYGFFFFVMGLLLLGIGLWVTNVKASFEAINDSLSVPAILALIIGIVLLIVAVIGLIGIIREHLCMLKFFLSIIIIAFIVQVVIGVLAFVYREKTVDVSSEQLKFAIKGYFDNENLQNSVDYIQSQLQCCGLQGPSDWDFNANFSCNNQDSPNNCGLPTSCCVEQSADCLGGPSIRRRITSSKLNKHGVNNDGCSEYFLRWIEDHLDATGATAMGFAILHILRIFFVYMFISKVEDYKKLFKYRKRIYETE